MRLGRLAASMAVVLGAALAARAQAPAGGTLPLSLPDAVQMGLAKNPDLASARDEVAAATASRNGARGMMLPKLSASWQGALYSSPLEINFAESIPGIPAG